MPERFIDAMSTLAERTRHAVAAACPMHGIEDKEYLTHTVTMLKEYEAESDRLRANLSPGERAAVDGASKAAIAKFMDKLLPSIKRGYMEANPASVGVPQDYIEAEMLKSNALTDQEKTLLVLSFRDRYFRGLKHIYETKLKA